jgi:hypothetical protein
MLPHILHLRGDDVPILFVTYIELQLKQNILAR